MITGSKETTPATPAANKYRLFEDSVDSRIKSKDEFGVVNLLQSNGLDRNYLLNGGFAIIQRLAAALTNITGPSATARVFTADKWGFTVGNVTTPQFQQVDTITAPETNSTSRFYARYKQLTNAAKMCISQVIPGTETSRLRGRTVRLQVKLRRSVGSNANVKIGILQLNNAGTVDTIPATFISAFNADTVVPTWGTNLVAISPTLIESTGSASGSFIQCPVTGTWTRFSGTFLIPSNCVNLVVVIFNDTVGAANDDLLIGECDLHDGQEIFDWMELPLDTQLIRCQRYFSKSFPYATVPVQNAGLTGALKGLAVIAGAIALAGQIWWRFPIEMFKTPTITLFNPSAANAQMRRYSGTATDQTATTTANLTSSGTDITATGDASGVIGSTEAIHATADSEI